jgi:hypothetical protein
MPYAVKAVLKAYNARHPEKPLPLPEEKGGEDHAS